MPIPVGIVIYCDLFFGMETRRKGFIEEGTRIPGPPAIGSQMAITSFYKGTVTILSNSVTNQY